MNRELDGVYFRVSRNLKYENICFSDLTTEEQSDVLKNKDVEWVKSLTYRLAKVIKSIGDQLDLVSENSDLVEVE